MNDDDTDLLNEQQAEEAFASGFPDEAAPTKPATEAKEKPETKTEEPSPPTAKPKYARFTEEEATELRNLKAWAQQGLDKAWGSAGNAHKLINELKATIEQMRAATPQAAVKLKKDAFAKMAKDFPELAAQFHEALENGFEGATGTASAKLDPAEIERIVDARVTARELRALEHDYPDWRNIVGAVDQGEQPDPNQAFRKWLATKPTTYQDEINNTHSGLVLDRAIRRFERETKIPEPPANARNQQRTAQLREAQQPQGDGGRVPAARDDDFETGFKEESG